MTRRVSGKLFPPIKPYNFGYLSVGGGHEIYYEECGNPKGVPVLYLHGGPGAGCDADCRRFFNPRICRAVLFDQRGSGRSKPYGSIVENTTSHLIGDTCQLLDVLCIKRAALFGGSWGSTLAMLFAIAHPENVSGMVLRGVWLAEDESLKDYCRGIPNTRFPEVWKRFIAQVPPARRANPIKYYYEKITTGSPVERDHFCYELWRYETSRCFLVAPTEKQLAKMLKEDSSGRAISILEAHYIRSRAFIDDGYILKHIPYIPRVPIVIVQGRYDDVCPVDQALRLHKVLPWAKLHVVTAGHSRNDPEIQKLLLSETNAMALQLKL